MSGWSDPYRLPQSVIPERYDLELAPELSTGTFRGREAVRLTVRETVCEIVLNAAELNFQSVSIHDDSGRRLTGSVRLDEPTERAHLAFSAPLAPGVWTLDITFTGILNDALRGFYRSVVRTEGGVATTLAVTQFEATDARRAFPCWDEPAYKAIFQVTLIVDEGLTALSNSAVAETRPAGAGRCAVVFAPTIPMSTYLVAFVVGRLEATAPVLADGVPIRVWAVPGKGHLGAFALEAAAFSLRFFREYYGIAYPGDKLDLIAIPDFAFGAMENLGAITFRETALLADERTATHGELTRVAHVVMHEIAHMWFGDLVTMAWWNGLWLNEAFATVMEVMAVDAWKPAWGRWDSFGAARAAAYLTDGLAASRPVEFPVAAPKDAEAMFDVLTYEKGGSVLRMLEQYLGPEVFRDGVRRFLAAHQCGNAETRDLWRALGAASGQAISEIMEEWIFRAGYPLVEARLAEDGRSLRLSQCRFAYLPGAGDETRWRIPLGLRFRVNGRIEQRRLLLEGAETRLPLPAAPDWVVVNDGGHGFYRVHYGDDLRAALLAAPFEILSPIERFNLVSDAWAVALAGRLPVGAYLDLTARFAAESDRHVWSALLAALSWLSRLVEPAARPAFAALVRSRLGGAVERLGWAPRAGESELTRQLRGDVLRAAGILGDDPTVQAAARLWYAHLTRGTVSLDPDVAAAVVPIVAHVGEESEYEEYLVGLRAATTPQAEQRYLRALTEFRSTALVRRTLELAVSDAVRSQDAPLVLRDLLLAPHSREPAWAFLKEHWEAIQRRLPSLAGMRRMCEGIVGLVTPALEADVRAFCATRGVSLGGKALEQDLEQLRIAVAFKEHAGAELAAYLSGFAGPPGGR
jgi:puromycin-sensitive aminopeptidase